MKYAILDQFPETAQSRKASNILADFACGAALGASISTLFFPVNVVKTKMQANIGTPFENFSKVFGDVWRERNQNVKELFRGAQLNFLRSLIAWGITNATYEYLRRWFG